MLRVYHSNRLDVLEALMEFIVERQRLDDPFMPEMVLVQSTGMAQWLQMTLAARFGIAANIEFPLPASFIWDMFVRVLKICFLKFTYSIIFCTVSFLNISLI